MLGHYGYFLLRKLIKEVNRQKEELSQEGVEKQGLRRREPLGGGCGASWRGGT